MGFLDKAKESLKAEMNKQSEKAKQDLLRKKEMDEQGIPYCPKCLSTSVTANKKGVGIGKAVVGGALLGPVGLLAGGIGKNKMELYCMKCGHKFKP
ncbi:hypothetical protein [Desulfosporosinus sp. FKB]|uniref:hypothetical protein n=1 Tax=Desulfosporosinus sp. FKB TaxID=1969835 RepID=UPI000B49F6A2|nr:hypothetical protein [Desulfosporosinus sp. FKB]